MTISVWMRIVLQPAPQVHCRHPEPPGPQHLGKALMNSALCPRITAWWAMFAAIIDLPAPLGPTRMMLLVS